jgi:colicin import membrane protein
MIRADDVRGRNRIFHPGALRALKKLALAHADEQAAEAEAERAALPVVTELDVAKGVRDGVLASPTPFGNSQYVALRVSGTGCAYRASLKEFTWRPPEIWLSDEMIARCNGLPIIIGHPGGALMTSKDFGQRIVGIVVLAYTKDEELWGVARVLDETAAKLIEQGKFDSSPAVLFPEGRVGVYIDVDGDKLLVEGEPQFVDHVGLIWTGDGNVGVWSRDNGPGVQSDGAKK